MQIVTPANQTTTINHSENRIFDFNTVNSRFYLGRTSNNLLRAFGDHVIDGLLVNSSIENNIANFAITPGTVIVDNTFVQLNSDIFLNIDLTGLDSNGKLLVSIDYSYIFTTARNLCTTGVYYWINNITPGFQYYNNKNHVILGLFNFNLIEQTITEVPNPVLNRVSNDIYGKNYFIRPYSNIENRILNIINYTFN